MGEDWKYYNVDDYNAWKRKQGKSFRSPPRANYLAAANHITSILDGKKVSWAAMCSLAMLCLGSRRDMPDIHIVYDDRDFQRIKSKLESDKRVSLPKGMIPLFPAKILIATGPKYKDGDCTENVEVEVDLVPPGANGSPTIDTFRNNQVLLRLNLDGKINNYRGLNMLYLVKTMLQYCKSKELAWDPKKDVTFLCRSYGNEIGKVRHQLNQEEIQEIFLSTSYFAKLSADDQRKCYNVLLDKEPPPTMSITPPPLQSGHRSANSAPGQSTKPPLMAQKSSPALKTGSQRSSKFLSPPVPGKLRSRPMQSPSNLPASTSMGTGTQAQLVPVYSTTTDSRSRYRAVSASNIPNSAVNKSSQLGHANLSRLISTAPRPPHHQVTDQSHAAARGIEAQNAPNFSRPQMIQIQANSQAPMSAPKMRPVSQKSMPNLKPSHTTTIPVPTLPHNTHHHRPIASHVLPKTSSHNIPPVGIASAQRAQAKISPQRTTQGPQQGSQINTRARTTNSYVATQPNGVPSPVLGKAPLAAQRIEEYRNNSVPNPDSIKPILDEASFTQAAGLRLVGPEGVYSTPEKPPQAKRLAPTPVPSPTHNPGATLEPVIYLPMSNDVTFAYELEASAVQSTPRPISPQELPANDPVVSIQKQSNVSQPTQNLQNSQHFQGISNTESRPTTPPEPAHFAQNVVLQPKPPAGASTLTPNSQNGPFPTGIIPTSLKAGGATRQRSPSRSPDRSPQLSSSMHTNASIYQQYYSPSSSPNHEHIVAHAAPVSKYKAYSGSISPPVPAPGQSMMWPNFGTGSASTGNRMPVAQRPTCSSSNAQPDQYSFPKMNPLAAKLSPPVSPEKRDHSPQQQSISLSSKEKGDTVTTLGYAAFSYRNSGEPNASTQTQMQTQYQQPVEQVWFNQNQTHGQSHQQQWQPQYVNAQPSAYTHNQSQPLDQQPNTQAPPVQWTHPAIHSHNSSQSHPVPLQSHPHYPLTHKDITHPDSPTPSSSHQRSTSHDSDKLAQEYQMELPQYGDREYRNSASASCGEEYVKHSGDGSKTDEEGDRIGEGMGNAGQRDSEVYEFIDFT